MKVEVSPQIIQRSGTLIRPCEKIYKPSTITNNTYCEDSILATILWVSLEWEASVEAVKEN